MCKDFQECGRWQTSYGDDRVGVGHVNAGSNRQPPHLGHLTGLFRSQAAAVDSCEAEGAC
jgi:hypothetical protein